MICTMIGVQAGEQAGMKTRGNSCWGGRGCRICALAATPLNVSDAVLITYGNRKGQKIHWIQRDVGHDTIWPNSCCSGRYCHIDSQILPHVVDDFSH